MKHSVFITYKADECFYSFHYNERKHSQHLMAFWRFWRCLREILGVTSGRYDTLFSTPFLKHLNVQHTYSASFG